MIAAANPPKTLLTVPEAAAALHLSERGVYHLTERGVLPAYRFGRRVLIPRPALDALRLSRDQSQMRPVPVSLADRRLNRLRAEIPRPLPHHDPAARNEGVAET